VGSYELPGQDEHRSRPVELRNMNRAHYSRSSGAPAAWRARLSIS
jgi:hypothetical protein